MNNEPVTGPGGARKFLGSLREALVAAGRDELKTDDKIMMEARAQRKAATTTTIAAKDGQRRSAGDGLAVSAAKDVAVARQADSACTEPAREDGEIRATKEPAREDAADNRPESKPQPADRTGAPTTDRTARNRAGRQSAADAAALARGDIKTRTERQHIEMIQDATAQSPDVGAMATAKAQPEPAPAQTQLVRGRAKVGRDGFAQDPVVGWLVVVGGPGLGSFRPIFEGNNTIGRSSSQRIAIDFGDEAISSEEQAYIRYDSIDRNFLFVPNLAKTNIVQLNHKKPTSAVQLSAMDVITMGHTQLVFVPFCGAEFDWSELSDLKE